MPLTVDSSWTHHVPFVEIARRDQNAFAALAAIGVGMGYVDSSIAKTVGLAVAFAIGVLSPIAAIAAVGVAIPFIYHPVDLAGGSWSLLELAIAIAGVSVGLRILFLVVQQRTVTLILQLLRPWTLTIAAFAIVVVGAVSLITVADARFRGDSLRAFRWTIVEPVAMLFCYRWAFRQRGARRFILAMFLAMGLVIAVDAGFQLGRGHGVVIADGVERATGPYPHPNNLALYLDRVGTVLLALTMSLPRWRGYLLPAAVLSALGLATTLSRGGAVAYLGGAFFLILLLRIRHGGRWLLLGGVAVVAVVAAIGPDRLTDRGAAGVKSSRELIWESSVDMLRDHPLTGVGLDQFLNQYNRRYVDPAGWPERYTSHPHNLVLDLWLSLGLPGLAAMITLVIVVAKQARHRPVDGESRAIWGAALATLVAGVIHGLVDNGYFLPDLAVMTWLLIALLESSGELPVVATGGAHHE